MDQKKILLLVSQPANGASHNDNHERLHLAFANAGWQVDIYPHNSLALRAEEPHIGNTPLTGYTLVWPIGFGPREGYNKRLAILDHVDKNIISPARSVSRLHNKVHWLDFAPESHASNDPDILSNIATKGGDWILKPAIGSFGRAVSKIGRAEEITKIIPRPSTDPWILQRYIEGIGAGEYRTIVALGSIIGSYRRSPTDGLHANLALGSKAHAAELPDEDARIVHRVIELLNIEKIGFAAVDTCSGFAIEVNVVNPGGLRTLDELYQTDSATRVVRLVEANL